MHKHRNRKGRKGKGKKKTQQLPISNPESSTSEAEFEVEDVELPFESVVKISASLTPVSYISPWEREPSFDVIGTGFIIDNKRIITNAHVVAEATFITLSAHGSGKRYTAKVKHIGHDCDLAILEVSDESFWDGKKPLKFSKDVPKLQDEVVIAGYPEGGTEISITKGIVSRIQLDSYTYSLDLLKITIDAAINPGSSGAPCFNLRDDAVTGIAFESLLGAENVGYIIPSCIVVHFLDTIDKFSKYTGFVDLGVKYQTLENPTLAENYGLKEASGILVRKVCNDQIKKGDIILEIDSKKIAGDGSVSWKKNRVDFRHFVSLKFAGDSVTLKICRNSQIIDVKVTLSVIPLLVVDSLNAIPQYYIVGGLVFVPLSGPLFISLKENDTHSITLKKKIMSCPFREFEGQQLIVLGRILKDEINFGYDDLEGDLVRAVNDVPVKNLAHLKELVEGTTGKNIIFTIDEEYQIVLNKKQTEEQDPLIFQKYFVTAKTNLK